RHRPILRFLALVTALAAAAGLSAQSRPPATPAHPATVAGARAFLAEVDRELLRLTNAANRAGWVQSTYITPDTEALAADANQALIEKITEYAKASVRFETVRLPLLERRQLEVLQKQLTVS